MPWWDYETFASTASSQLVIWYFCLLEGNHETDNMNQMYGFEGEVKEKYGGNTMALFSEVFNWLPLAYCINAKVLVSIQVPAVVEYIFSTCAFKCQTRKINLYSPKNLVGAASQMRRMSLSVIF